MVHESGIHERLRDSADQAWRLYCALGHDIAHRPSKAGGQETKRQRLSASPTPGNSVAIELTLEFDREIRRLEVHLKERITGGYPKRRGSSNTNTRYAIDSVVKLCTTSDAETILGVLGYLTRWTHRAEVVYHPEKGLHRLPRQPGEGEARCPYCQRQTMRWNPHDGRAICVYPACLNGDGERPRWTVDFTPTVNGLVFHWDEVKAA